VSFIVFVVLYAVFRLIVVLFCVMCVICLLCLIVNQCHWVKTHLQLINITLHNFFSTFSRTLWEEIGLFPTGISFLNNFYFNITSLLYFCVLIFILTLYEGK
jgi:hypothetical protein